MEVGLTGLNSGSPIAISNPAFEKVSIFDQTPEFAAGSTLAIKGSIDERG